MEVILIKDVPGLGFQDEKVRVKDGFGRNYLIPKGLCVLSNKSNSKILEEKLKQTVKKQEEILKSAEKIAKKIGDLILEIKLKSGSEDKVFGSVTTLHISKMLDEKGFEIDKRNITLSSKVNSTGEYTVYIKLHKDITHEIILNVTGTSIKKKTKTSKKKKGEISDESAKNSEKPILEKEKTNLKKDNKKEEPTVNNPAIKEDPEKKS
ncbi:MAG: 50S ribosomal protein L9 [Flammeovirgaceae bacterium TMED290]|nr:MAG: 50S ribosomal protein L9 [Flammeovirgaceae bacterium TMED290]|tara:strand:- start:1818 stop:2441 length:624 start_codon:yes stop_codon:yes gene_type:complete